MISYEPFWKTMKDRNISTYMMTNDLEYSSSTLNRLRHNQHITTLTINRLCQTLQCNVSDILVYKPDVEK